jgi:hypothetical protein
MTFEIGHTISLGRPKGSRNKRTAELFNRLEARGDIDPADFLSALVTNEQEPKELRIQASGLLLPYMHPKLASLPTPRFIEKPFELPKYTTIQEAEQILSQLLDLYTRGELDSQSFTELTTGIKTWIEAKTASDLEQRLMLIEQSLERNPATETKAVTGGMPRLPGTDVIMP